MKKNFNFLLIFFIVKIFLLTQEFQFDVSIDMNELESGGGFRIADTRNKACGTWLPSLFMPILYVPDSTVIKEGTLIPDQKINLKSPFFNDNIEFVAQMFKNISFLTNDLNGILMRPLSASVYNCYFGISPRINITGLEEGNSLLNDLKNNNLIVNKIFSFQEWDITSNPVKTKFYLGDSHNVFNSDTGIIGTCENEPNNSLWGCPFKEMILNNINIPLTNENGLYKIYFASETHNIIFPKKFEDIIIKSSNNSCAFNYKVNYLKCEDFFKDSYYVPLQLTEENENFVITGQVDSLGRFNEKKDENKDYVRIQFENIDYIILPLMAFKEFHVQFDAGYNLIKFYTNNPNILKVKKTKSGTSGLSVFIVILIIIILLGLGFAVFWFIKNRRKTGTNINKFSKFEDEEDYQNINEKKVF